MAEARITVDDFERGQPRSTCALSGAPNPDIDVRLVAQHIPVGSGCLLLLGIVPYLFVRALGQKQVTGHVWVDRRAEADARLANRKRAMPWVIGAGGIALVSFVVGVVLGLAHGPSAGAFVIAALGAFIALRWAVEMRSGSAAKAIRANLDSQGRWVTLSGVSDKYDTMLRERYVCPPSPSFGPVPHNIQPPTPPATVAVELGRLAEVRDRGVLTEQEFAAQKRRLLRG